MSSIIFSDKDRAPTEVELRETIGKPFDLWPMIIQSMEKTCGPVVMEWKYFGKKNGWLGKNLVNDRNMFFFIPLEGRFNLAFTFGEKAISEIENNHFPESILRSLREAKEYVEGKTIQISVVAEADCDLANRLIQIKHDN